jgi:hypothetical protein
LRRRRRCSRAGRALTLEQSNPVRTPAFAGQSSAQRSQLVARTARKAMPGARGTLRRRVAQRLTLSPLSTRHHDGPLTAVLNLTARWGRQHRVLGGERLIKHGSQVSERRGRRTQQRSVPNPI